MPKCTPFRTRLLLSFVAVVALVLDLGIGFRSGFRGVVAGGGRGWPRCWPLRAC